MADEVFNNYDLLTAVRFKLLERDDNPTRTTSPWLAK